jgi:cytochrome c-type biogenesis protein CcmH/NrfG
MLEKMGDVAEAQQLLVRSVKLNPGHAASWVALAGINRRKGDLGTARYCLSSAVEGDPRSYVALQAWGSLEADSGEAGSAEKARELFGHALAISATSVHTLHAWAMLEKREGR